MTAYTPDIVVAKYVEVRDQLKIEEDAHAERMKPKREALEKMEAWLLDYLNREKVESARTAAGTAYKSHSLSVQMGDWDTFFGWVVSRAIERALAAVEAGGGETDAARAFTATPELSFLTHAVAKTAVQEHMDKHEGQPPPGVRTTTFVKVGVRRA